LFLLTSQKIGIKKAVDIAVYAYGLKLSNEYVIYFSKGILLPLQFECRQCQPPVAVSEWRRKFANIISFAFRYYLLKGIITWIYLSRKNRGFADRYVPFLIKTRIILH